MARDYDVWATDVLKTESSSVRVEIRPFPQLSFLKRIKSQGASPQLTIFKITQVFLLSVFSRKRQRIIWILFILSYFYWVVVKMLIIKWFLAAPQLQVFRCRWWSFSLPCSCWCLHRETAISGFPAGTDCAETHPLRGSQVSDSHAEGFVGNALRCFLVSACVSVSAAESDTQTKACHHSPTNKICIPRTPPSTDLRTDPPHLFLLFVSYLLINLFSHSCLHTRSA